MANLLPVLSWGGPVGIGIFFVGLGVLLWGVGAVSKASKKE